MESNQSTISDSAYGNILEKEQLLTILKEKVFNKGRTKKQNEHTIKFILQARVDENYCAIMNR